MELKVGDFGLATKADPAGGRRKTLCGTPNYLAPEILMKLGHSFEVDVWAVGVICYTLLIGKLPFEAEDLKSIYKRIQKNDYHFREEIPISEVAKDFIAKILVTDPSKRLSLDEMLGHPFLNGQTQDLKPKQNSSFVGLPSIITPHPSTKRNNIKHILSVSPKVPRAKIISHNRKSSDVTTKNLPENRKVNATSQFGIRAGKNILITPSKRNLSPKNIIKNKNFKSLKNSYAITSSATSSEDTAESDKNSDEVLVCQDVIALQWLEYAKYGIGYLLSNGLIGVLFNDSTTMLLNPKTMVFEYILKDLIQKNDIVVLYSLTDEPPELQKKIMILKHLKDLFRENKSENQMNDAYKMINNSNESIHVKKWLKAKQAVIFRFNNKTLQVMFKDNSKLIVNYQKNIVFYTDVEGQENQFQIDKISDSENYSLQNYIKYTQSVLHQAWGDDKVI